MSAPLIEIRDAGFSYGEQAVFGGVDLDVYAGEVLTILGPNGCGKSTLLQLIAGLSSPSSGSIVLKGKEIDGPGPERGMVFQRDSVFPWMRVIDNVQYGLKCRGVGARSPRQPRRVIRVDRG